MNSVTPHQITLYSRPGCHLCEAAVDLLDLLAQQVPLVLHEVNILGDPLLYERYKWLIPVIAVAAGPTFTAPIDFQELEYVLLRPL